MWSLGGGAIGSLFDYPWAGVGIGLALWVGLVYTAASIGRRNAPAAQSAGAELDEMRTYTVVIEPDEDGVYIATVPALPGVVEQGDTQEEAFERVREAAHFTLDNMAERGEEIPPSDTGRKIVREY